MDVLKRIDFVQQFAKEYADGAWSIDVDQWKHHVTPEFIEDIRQYIESLHLKLMYLQTQQAKQRICVGESYEMIDRFLRNNLGDDDYESYSDALCEVAAPQPAQPSEPAQPEQGELAGPDQIEKIVDRYVDEYEFTDGENAYHSPNEFEQMLIKDAFYGLLVDEEWDAAWGAHIASLQSAQPVAQPAWTTSTQVLEARAEAEKRLNAQLRKAMDAMPIAQPVAQPNIQNQIVKDISRHEPCHTCAHYQQGKLPGVRIHDETCYECRSYWGNKWEAA